MEPLLTDSLTVESLLLSLNDILFTNSSFDRHLRLISSLSSGGFRTYLLSRLSRSCCQFLVSRGHVILSTNWFCSQLNSTAPVPVNCNRALQTVASLGCEYDCACLRMNYQLCMSVQVLVEAHAVEQSSSSSTVYIGNAMRAIPIYYCVLCDITSKMRI